MRFEIGARGLERAALNFAGGWEVKRGRTGKCYGRVVGRVVSGWVGLANGDARILHTS